MAKAGRLILAVIAGAAVWAVLWIAGTKLTQIVWPELATDGQPITHLGIMLGYIIYSVILSILAGYTTAATAGAQPMPAVWVLATLQLTLGIIAEVSYWELLPVWYHLVFLALVVPGTVYGGVLRTQLKARPIGAVA